MHHENVLEPVIYAVIAIMLTVLIVRVSDGDITGCFVTVLGAAASMVEARRRLMHNLKHMREHKHITVKEELL